MLYTRRFQKIFVFSSILGDKYSINIEFAEETSCNKSKSRPQLVPRVVALVAGLHPAELVLADLAAPVNLGLVLDQERLLLEC